MVDLPAILGGSPVRTRPWPSWPRATEEDEARVVAVLREGVWSRADGPWVRRLEEDFARVHGAAHGVAMMSGTVTLVLALRALGVGPGDEVIVPPYTFVATATAVLEVGALPVFADIHPGTLCLDPDAVAAAVSPRTRAVIPVHLGGHPADMDRILQVARRHRLAVVEDAAHAHGARWRGRSVGSFGDAGSFSFQASKNMTSGEGGILLTSREDLFRAVRSLRNCGRAEGGAWYEHHLLGGNHRLTELQAALLVGQLGRLEEEGTRREAAGKVLEEALPSVGLAPQARDPGVDRHGRHLFIARYRPEEFAGLSREGFVRALAAEGIPASPGYPYPLYRNPLFQNRAWDRRVTGPGDARTDYGRARCPVAEDWCRAAVWLPQQVLLAGPEEMGDVVEAVARIRRHAPRVVRALGEAGRS